MKIKVSSTAGLVVLAIVLGIIGWLHALGVLGFREVSLVSALVVTIPDSFLFGLIIGSINTKRWLLAGVTAWMNALGVVFVLVDMIETRQMAIVDVRDLALFLSSLGLAFLGGYAATILVGKLGRKRVLTGAILLVVIAIALSSLWLL